MIYYLWGGELGVSIFFVISGFSIYKNLSKNQNQNYLDFIKNRIKRIGPHYYISLFLVLILTNCAIYISADHMLNLVSHTFFFHNLFYSYHGAINGVLWTMGVIFQFYLIAPLLKKCVDKSPVPTFIVSTFIAIMIKYILFYYIFPKNNLGNMYYFIYGRQLFTSLDAFVLGMIISKINVRENKFNKLYAMLCAISIVIVLLCGSGYFSFLGDSYLYSSSFKGLFFFLILDCIIALLIYFVSSIKIPSNGLTNILLFLSKHEYSIYVWHLLILNSIINYSEAYAFFKGQSQVLTYIILIILLIILGIIIDVFISNIDFLKVKSELALIFAKNKLHFFRIIIIIVFCFSITLVPKIVNNFANTKSTLSICDDACMIYMNNKDKIKCGKKQCEYIYIDKEDTGYFNFYQLRYLLSPHKTIHYNEYVYTINHSSEKEIFDYIINSNVDYVIVKDNDILEQYGYKLDKVNGKVYTINKSAESILSLLKEVI